MVVTEIALDGGARFELIERIGAGNHGVVYRAHDHQLHRDVAIKRFAHVLTDDPRAMHRIRREVNSLARVSHRNVVTVHDLVMLPDGDGEETPHLVMELVEGVSVREFLDQHGPSVQSVGLVRQVLEGLEACHRADILHLDIKPANVLVTDAGDVRIVDFGISRAASDLTATIAGTPHYMAPEQYEGKVDRRSDLYSVACLLFETLTGQVPFPGSPAVQLMSHRSGERPDPRALNPEVTPELVGVLHRAMSIDPDERPDTARQFARELDAVATSSAGGDVDTQPNPVVRAPLRIAPSAEAVSGVGDAAQPEPSLASRVASAVGGFMAAAFFMGLVPAIVLLSTGAEPAASYRPSFMAESTHLAWWLVAVVLAALHLVVRRRRPGLISGLSAAFRGSLPLFFPWYAAGVSGLALANGIDRPELYGSWWDVAWVLMPFVAFVLLISAVRRVRFGFGSFLMFVARLLGAALAVGLFLAYPALA